MSATVEDIAEIFLLFVIELTEKTFEEDSEKPIMALSGVRSSWDILARNSDLWRLAASSWW